MPGFNSSYFQKIGSQVTRSVADLFFPSSCFGCGKQGDWLCPHCARRTPTLAIQHCFVCNQNQTRFGEACFQCANCATEEHPLDALFSATCYHAPVIKRMIHAYKYRFVTNLSLPLGHLFAQSVEKSALPLPHFIAPVPLHKKRLRYRGFNQSHILTETLIHLVPALQSTPLIAALQRIRFTSPQQKTRSKQERVTNLTNAFQVTPDTEVRNKIIWLVDDVATTKSTLTECARTLKAAGAHKVYAVVLAKD